MNIPWVAVVDGLSWFIWNPALGTVAGIFFGRAVVNVIVGR